MPPPPSSLIRSPSFPTTGMDFLDEQIGEAFCLLPPLCSFGPRTRDLVSGGSGGRERMSPWPYPSSWSFNLNDGLDGGVRYLLRSSGVLWLPGKTFDYQGSLASLYTSQYGVGVYKCCNTVVNFFPITLNYSFDTDFLDPFPTCLPGRLECRTLWPWAFASCSTSN